MADNKAEIEILKDKLIFYKDMVRYQASRMHKEEERLQTYKELIRKTTKKIKQLKSGKNE